MAFNNYKKWSVVLVDLNPVKGAEINKIRPCLIISPSVANKNLLTVIVAPLTSTIRHIPTRLKTNFNNKPGKICFDQMKAIDKSRIVKFLGNLDPVERSSVNALFLILIKLYRSLLSYDVRGQ